MKIVIRQLDTRISSEQILMVMQQVSVLVVTMAAYQEFLGKIQWAYMYQARTPVTTVISHQTNLQLLKGLNGIIRVL